MSSSASAAPAAATSAPSYASPTAERTAVASMVDHTLLKTDATRAQVAALISEAQALGTCCVCISPSMLPVPSYPGPKVLLCTVVGFPSGKHSSAVKAFEAREAVANGAGEIDMVIDVGCAKEGRWADVEKDIAAVRAAVPKPIVLKVILESAALTDAELVAACEASERAGADFVKTSTGFHAAGGATVHAVRIMRQTVGDRLGVKASGGIRTAEQARALIAAGATRLGLSGTKALLDEIASASA